jgi:hypothetical protein
MTVQFNTSGNLYLVGNVGLHVADYYDEATGVVTLDLTAYIELEASYYPLPSASTAAILYKISPVLSIGAVYDNTQIYQGIPNTYQIGSYNYGNRGSYYAREFVNFQLQTLKECSGFNPPEGIVAGTSETLYAYGVPNPPAYNPVDKLYLYLPNADIDSVEIDLHYHLEQFSAATEAYGYIWTQLSDTYGS